MFDTLRMIRAQIRDVAARNGRQLPPADQAATLLRQVGAIENSCAAIRVRLSGGIAADASVWQQTGARSAAHFIAQATGATISRAAETIETSKRLEALPATAHASAEGTVSETQVKEIATAASLDPSSEASLLQTALSGDVTALREHCRRVEYSAITDETERYEAIHRSRYLRSWSDHDGAFRLDARLTPMPEPR
jgi:hypothetical protein